MKRIPLQSALFSLLLSSLLLCFFPGALLAYKASDFHWAPPLFSNVVKPTVHIVLDSSGSMLQRANENIPFGDPRASYYGYADPNKKYSYQKGQGYFYEDTKGEWSGKFLNWAMMHRTDVAKKVLIGGKHSDGFYEVATLDWDKRIPPFKAYQSEASGAVPDDFFKHNAEITIKHTVNQPTLEITYAQNKNKNVTESFQMRIEVPQGFEPTGVLDQFKDNVRLSLFIYDSDRYYNGGRIQAYVGDDYNELRKKVSAAPANSNTPLGETLYTVCGYIQQSTDGGSTGNNNGPRYYGDSTYKLTKGKKGDPFWFGGENEQGMIHCSKQKIILITDGEPTLDENIPNSAAPTAGMLEDVPGSGKKLDNLAYWAHTTNLRPSSDFPDLSPGEAFDTSAEVYAIYAAFGGGTEAGRNLLKNTCRHGAFPKDGWESLSASERKERIKAYDPVYHGETNKKGTYFEADKGEQLEEALRVAVGAASAQASGTAPTPSPQGLEGEGATYQAIFFPPKENEDNATFWSGQVHAFFTDSFGNLREDSNGNRILDANDKAIRYENGIPTRYTVNATTGKLLPGAQPITSKEINYLWSSTDWLQNSNAEGQRAYDMPGNQRYIFTAVDQLQTMAGLQPKPFIAPDQPQFVKDPSNFGSYLTLWESSGEPGGLPPQEKRLQLAKDQVNFIRGKEMKTDSNNALVRSRTDKNGKKWLLGDIIYSTPTVVGAPAENYFAGYKDRSYKKFYDKYRHRRQVVYVGANDCMLHAFNAGFFHDANGTAGSAPRFELDRDGEAKHELGAELWAYVPYNLLPHLRWLMNPRYNNVTDWAHIAGMDLKPYVFDARIFRDDEKHPGGWGTILVAGMRLGGAEIQVDVKKEGNDPDRVRTMSSAYVIMDITDPENPPVLLGEIRMPRLGFTTCMPTAMPMARLDTDGTLDVNHSENDWYLVFGSGPADNQGRASRLWLDSRQLYSQQEAVLYVLDLKALAQQGKVRYLDDKRIFHDMSDPQEKMYAWECDEDMSMISSPMAVDLHKGSTNASLAMKADAVYFGTANYDGSGTMYRLYTNNNNAPNNWGISALAKVKKPIVAPVNISHSGKQRAEERLWIYFGAGRYFNQHDNSLTGMSFYGIKEPIVEGEFGPDGRPLIDWSEEVKVEDLFPSANATLNYDAGNTEDRVKIKTPGMANALSWKDFETMVMKKYAGWYYELAPKERVTEQATIFGGATYFTSYTPSGDVCTAREGFSRLYGLFYTTGTPYYKPIFIDRHSPRNPAYVDLGSGQASKPALVIGKDGKVSVKVGKEDGSIHEETTDSPIKYRSHLLYWQER